MPLFSGIRKRLHDRLLKRKAQKLQVGRAYRTYGDAAFIGLLCAPEQPEALQILEQLLTGLREEDKKVHGVLYWPFSRPAQPDFRHKGWDILTPRELNWLFVPPPPLVKRFTQKKFDLLCNLYRTPVYPLRHLATLSQAKLRVGAYPANASDKQKLLDCNDMLIDTGKDKSLTFLFEQIKHYLQNKKRTS